MILYTTTKIETKADYIRWQMHYKFREKLINEVMAKVFNKNTFVNSVVEDA